MMDLNGLVPEVPIAPCVAINNLISVPIVGADFAIFGLIGGKGAPVNLFLAGLEPSFYHMSKDKDSLSVVLHDGDMVVFSFGGAELKSNQLSWKDCNSFINEKNRGRDIALEESKNFLGWRFQIESSDGQVQSIASVPFEIIQARFVWRPGEAHAVFCVEVLTVQEDGSTDGDVLMEKKVLIDASLKIAIEGVR
jgi:hypothetical protein